jgi:hypothetical protein
MVLVAAYGIVPKNNTIAVMCYLLLLGNTLRRTPWIKPPGGIFSDSME